MNESMGPPGGPSEARSGGRTGGAAAPNLRRRSGGALDHAARAAVPAAHHATDTPGRSDLPGVRARGVAGTPSPKWSLPPQEIPTLHIRHSQRSDGLSRPHPVWKPGLEHLPRARDAQTGGAARGFFRALRRRVRRHADGVRALWLLALLALAGVAPQLAERWL